MRWVWAVAWAERASLRMAKLERLSLRKTPSPPPYSLQKEMPGGKFEGRHSWKKGMFLPSNVFLLYWDERDFSEERRKQFGSRLERSSLQKKTPSPEPYSLPKKQAKMWKEGFIRVSAWVIFVELRWRFKWLERVKCKKGMGRRGPRCRKCPNPYNTAARKNAEEGISEIDVRGFLKEVRARIVIKSSCVN